MSGQPSTAIVWAAIAKRPGQALTSRQLAADTGLSVQIVSALLRRFADRGQLAIVGRGAQHAAGGLTPNVYKTPA